MTNQTTYSIGSASGDAVRELLAAGAVSVDHYLVDGVDVPAPDFLTAVVPAGYQLAHLDLSEHYDHLRDQPRRITGAATLHQPASWLTYVARHCTDGTEVYADVNSGTVTAVLDGPRENTASGNRAGWGEHRAVLQLEQSEAWKAWKRVHGQWLSQDAMAEHLEARTPDLIEPDAATMLEIAQTIKATTGVRFESRSILHNGERRLQYLEEIDGKAGQRGDLAIPQQITLRLQPWRGADLAVMVTARFRYRIESGRLVLGVVIDRVTETKDSAWSALVEELGDGLSGAGVDVPVLAGTAPRYAG